MDINMLNNMNTNQEFSREELFEAYRGCGYTLSVASFNKNLEQLIAGGKIARIGRNAYCIPSKSLKIYRYDYSDLANEIVSNITENYPLVDFSIFELVQLNDFANHQIAHNTIFVNVEADALDFVFETLKEQYPGKILVNPSTEIYHQYWCENLIVLGKLVSEAPTGIDEDWKARLEKILVDIMANSLILDSVSEGDYPVIFENAFEHFIIDESCLFRYARRRKVDKKILALIKEKTNVKLRVKGQ